MQSEKALKLQNVLQMSYPDCKFMLFCYHYVNRENVLFYLHFDEIYVSRLVVSVDMLRQ